MFIRRDKLTPADTYSVRIIKGQRVGGKVKHKTILTVGTGTGEASIQKVEKEARDIIKNLRGVKLVSDDPRGSFYVFPSQLTTEQQEIYSAVGLTSRQAPLRV